MAVDLAERLAIPTSTCIVGATLDALEPRERDAVTAAIAWVAKNPGSHELSQQTIIDALDDKGFHIPERRLRTHMRRECTCG